MAFSVCWKISSFNFSLVPYLANNVTYTPGVSTIDANPLSIVIYLLSLVKPYYLSTIASLYPTIQLNKLLFPQFGSPTSETLNLEVSYVYISQFFCFFFFYYLIWIFSISWLLNKINWVDFVLLVKQ